MVHQRHELEKMTVPQIRALVRSHNLHTTYMKGYSKLRKADLITKLIAHTPVRGDAPAKAAAPKKKHASRHKPKMTALDKAMGVDKPLYSKAEGGLAEGARRQFEKRYGSSKDAAFLKRMGAKMKADEAAKLGRGKRGKRRPRRYRA